MQLLTIENERLINDIRLKVMESHLISVTYRHIYRYPSIRTKYPQVNISFFFLYRYRHLVFTKIIGSYISYIGIPEKFRYSYILYIK